MRRLVALSAACTLLLLSPAPAPACPTAQKLVEHLVDAHGGLGAWRSAPTVSFQDQWSQPEGEGGPPGRVVVEQGPRRAYIDYPGTDMSMAWDGQRAWSENWQNPAPPRFFALLNYHFANLPWLVHDPGVVLSEFGPRKLPNDPTEYFSVKITYEAGTGDTPDDYYRLYVHPDTHRLKATEYTVTYDALLPEGVDSTPANLLIYDEWQTVDGLLVPKHFTIYNPAGQVYFRCAFSDWSFSRGFDEGQMTPSANAVIDTSTP